MIITWNSWIEIIYISQTLAKFVGAKEQKNEVKTLPNLSWLKFMRENVKNRSSQKVNHVVKVLQHLDWLDSSAVGCRLSIL